MGDIRETLLICKCVECDKAFTRSDALAKHMRTVHEPEGAPRTTTNEGPTPPSKKDKHIKLKLTNGSSSTPSTNTPNRIPPPATTVAEAPTHDEDGNPITPSPASDNIAYIPAHHPITGQPGFMITYPPDIHFSAWESSIQADQLMRLLRRQLHWARKEQEMLREECEGLERARKEEWVLKEILMEGFMESEIARGDEERLILTGDAGGVYLRDAMEKDVHVARGLEWSGGFEPAWRRRNGNGQVDIDKDLRAREDWVMEDREEVQTPIDRTRTAERTPSPPPTGKSGGFDGDGDPFDNYLADQMARFEERERQKSSQQNTPQKVQVQRTEQQVASAEADAVGALIGMSGH